MFSLNKQNVNCLWPVETILHVLSVVSLDNCLVDLTQAKITVLQRFLKHDKCRFTSPQSVALVTNTSFYFYSTLTSLLPAA